jgi:transposase
MGIAVRRSPKGSIRLPVSHTIPWRKPAPAAACKPAGSKLDPHEAFILELIEELKDIACHEIAGTLEAEQGVRSCPATVWYFLDKHGLTHKKDGSCGNSSASKN